MIISDLDFVTSVSASSIAGAGGYGYKDKKDDKKGKGYNIYIKQDAAAFAEAYTKKGDAVAVATAVNAIKSDVDVYTGVRA